MSSIALKNAIRLCCASALGLSLAAPGFALPVIKSTITLNKPAPDHRQEIPAAGYKIPGPVNVLLNGNGDADVGANGSGQTVCPSHWTCRRQFTVVVYGAPDFPVPMPPAAPAAPTFAPDHGANLFAGGSEGPDSSASQTVDLHSFAGRIATGETFTLDAWLGGFDDQSDHAWVTVEFDDANGNALSAPTSLRTVMPGDRNNMRTFVERSATGTVPQGTVSAKVTISADEENGGYNDGYADSITLALN